MSSRDNQNSIQLDWQKLARIHEQMKNATKQELEKLTKEGEQELFKQLTEEQKQEVDNNLKTSLNYINKVFIPTQILQGE